MTSQPRLEFLDAASLDDNPSNWKFHPPEQLSSLAELIDELGWIKPLIYNERTRRLIDGHGRKQLAGTGATVPVYIVDLPEELEAKALATLDPIGWTAISDKRKYDELLKSNNLLSGTRDNIRKLLDQVSRASSMLNPGSDEAPGEARADGRDREAEVTVPLDSIWPSDNPWDVPCLLPEMQAESVPYPVWTWGSIGHRRPMPGTWHFYTSDAKFESLWKRPNRVMASGPGAICEPNFSTTDQTPMAHALWGVFRRRWLGRYWQQLGLRLFVDLNVDARLHCPCPGGGACSVNLLGVPRGWSAYSTRAHAGDPEALLPEWEIAKEWSGSESPLFLVIGGGKQVKALAQEHGWVWVPEQIQQIKARALEAANQ